MSTNVVHFLTVAGTAARQVEAACDSLLAKAVYDEDPDFRSPEWSEADAESISRLAESLLAGARVLPVVHYSAYVDGWSMCNHMLGFVPWPDGRKRVIASLGYAIAFYPATSFAPSRDAIRKSRRRKDYRTNSEFRLYLSHLDEAMAAGEWLNADRIVLAITECLGMSRHDDAIRSSLDKRMALD